MFCKLPPIVIPLGRFFPTWKDWFGTLRCWWHDTHDFQPSRNTSTSRSLQCSRCRVYIQILGEQDFTVKVLDVRFKSFCYKLEVRDHDEEPLEWDQHNFPY